MSNKGINTLSIDLPGHGASSGKGLDSIKKMGSWIIQLMDELNINSSIIAGHSMGSLIAIETAKQGKNKIKGFTNIQYKNSVKEALQDLKLQENDIVIITGSLYLAGEVLNLN